MSWNMEAALPGIACPALIIQGEGDEYGSPAQVDAIAAGMSGPASVMLVPGCNHIPHFQAADAVLPAIAEFIVDHA